MVEFQLQGAIESTTATQMYKNNVGNGVYE